MTARYDAMRDIHPLIAFAFFAFALIMPMLFLHPAFIVVSFIACSIWAIGLNGRAFWSLFLKFILPAALLVALLNPLFNHQGVTILFYLRDNPVTLESILYGLTSSLAFASALIWFSCFNTIFTSDKLIYLFGRFLPSVSLLITMILRFVPLYRRQSKKMAIAMQAQGSGTGEGGLIKRAKHGLAIFSAMITWGIESSVTTADSMRSRGHGLPNRSSYSLYRFTLRDAVFGTALLLGVVCVGFAAGFKRISAAFFPVIRLNAWDWASALTLVIYALTLSMPVILNIIEAVKWQYLKSRI